MSAKVVGMVLERFPGRDAQEFAIALTLADAADHDGTHVFPSVARVARLARTSERTVQRALAKFKDSGFLLVVRLGGGRGNPTQYAIDVDWLESQVSVLSDKKKG